MVNVHNMKDKLSMFKIQDCNYDVIDMLTAIELLYEEILREGGTHSDYEDNLVRALSIVDTAQFNLEIILIRGRRDKGEKVPASEIINIATQKYNSMVKRKKYHQ